MLDNKIVLRKITYNDTDLIIKWRNSNSVKKNLYTQTDLTREQHIGWMKNNVETGECSQFIIINNENPIGTVFIKNIDYKNSKGEFGIFIGEDRARGKGYGTIAAKKILNYAFRVLKLNKVYLSVFANNINAIKSYEKAGFKQEGRLKQDFKQNKNEYYDVILMAILKDEYIMD